MIATPPVPLVAARVQRGRTLRALWRDKAALIGLFILGILMLCAVAGPLLAPHSPTEVNVIERLKPPAWADGGSGSYLLGTDGLGRDILSRMIVAARVTLMIGVSVVVLSAFVGTLLGLVAGYKGGLWDTLIMRFADAQLAFPGLLVVLLVLAFLGSGTVVIIGVLAVYGWMIYARLVRGLALQLKQTPAIAAAELVGCSTPRILRRHLLPNLYSALLTQGMLELARVILVEAALSYLGLGVQPPNASWGLMVSENQEFISTAWWTVLFPGLAIAGTVLAVNLVANWLRIQSDPQQRQQRFGATGRRRSRRGGYVLSRAPERACSRAPAPKPPLRHTALLQVDDLDVRFHTEEGEFPAVRNGGLSIQPGETLGIVGESGSGKSTTALAIMDLVPPPGRVEHARINWRGQEVDRRELHDLRGSEITMIFQDPMTSLNPLVAVGRQVSEVLTRHNGLGRREARARTVELFRLVGIPNAEHRLRQFPYELSGGLRQRVMIAAALAAEPKLLIADEPTTALDTTIQAQILELIAELQERLGIAMILITHDLGVVARVCDRVTVMYGGRVVEEGLAELLFKSPRHPYTNALISTVPTIEQERGVLPTIPGNPPGRLSFITGCPFAPRCPRATELCEQEMPPLAPIGQGRRVAACHHPLPSITRTTPHDCDVRAEPA